MYKRQVLRHPINQGYGAAIKTGFRAARGELLAFLDADGTYPPEAFPALCRALAAEGADIVVGSRMAGEASGMPLVRRLGNGFFARLVSLTSGQRISDSASGQRVLRREVLARVYPLPDGLNFTPVMTTRAIHEGLRMVEVPIRYDERVGRSKLSVIHDGRRFLTTILWTAMGYNPGRVLALAGTALAGLGALCGLGLVALRLSGVTRLGPSGTGKTTAARNAAGAIVLNDDLVALLPGADGAWRLLATPFSNATQVRPAPGQAPLAGILRLRPASEPAIAALSAGRAVAELLGAVPVLVADAQRLPPLLERLNRLAAAAPCAILRLRDRPDYWPVVDAWLAEGQAVVPSG